MGFRATYVYVYVSPDPARLLSTGLVFSACGKTPSGGRVGLRLELAWLDRAETPC